MRVTTNNKRFTVRSNRHRLRHFHSKIVYREPAGTFANTSGAYGPQDK